MPAQRVLTEAEVDSVTKDIADGVAVSVVCRRLDISDTIFYRIRDGKHPVQVRRAVKADQLTGGAKCPACGRPFVHPCTVCKIRKNVVDVGLFSNKNWPKPPTPLAVSGETPPHTSAR